MQLNFKIFTCIISIFLKLTSSLSCQPTPFLPIRYNTPGFASCREEKTKYFIRDRCNENEQVNEATCLEDNNQEAYCQCPAGYASVRCNLGKSMYVTCKDINVLENCVLYPSDQDLVLLPHQKDDCTCENGTPRDEINCQRPGEHECESCDAGFYLDGRAICEEANRFKIVSNLYPLSPDEYFASLSFVQVYLEPIKGELSQWGIILFKENYTKIEDNSEAGINPTWRLDGPGRNYDLSKPHEGDTVMWPRDSGLSYSRLVVYSDLNSNDKIERYSFPRPLDFQSGSASATDGTLFPAKTSNDIDASPDNEITGPYGPFILPVLEGQTSTTFYVRGPATIRIFLCNNEKPYVTKTWYGTDVKERFESGNCLNIQLGQLSFEANIYDDFNGLRIDKDNKIWRKYARNDHPDHQDFLHNYGNHWYPSSTEYRDDPGCESHLHCYLVVNIDWFSNDLLVNLSLHGDSSDDLLITWSHTLKYTKWKDFPWRIVNDIGVMNTQNNGDVNWWLPTTISFGFEQTRLVACSKDFCSESIVFPMRDLGKGMLMDELWDTYDSAKANFQYYVYDTVLRSFSDSSQFCKRSKLELARFTSIAQAELLLKIVKHIFDQQQEQVQAQADPQNGLPPILKAHLGLKTISNNNIIYSPPDGEDYNGHIDINSDLESSLSDIQKVYGFSNSDDDLMAYLDGKISEIYMAQGRLMISSYGAIFFDNWGHIHDKGITICEQIRN